MFQNVISCIIRKKKNLPHVIVLRFPSISKRAHIWNARSAHELALVVLSEGALTGHGRATQNGISSSNWSELRAPQAALGRVPLGACAWTLPPHALSAVVPSL